MKSLHSSRFTLNIQNLPPMKRICLYTLFVFISAFSFASVKGFVTTWNAPVGAPLKHDYDVFVQSFGEKEWTRVDTYMAKVNAPIGEGKHKVSEISFACFDFTGEVNVKVVKHLDHASGKKTSVRVRPDSKGIQCDLQNDSTVVFRLSQPENLSVEFDGNITNNLLIFTNAPVQSVAEAKKEAKRQGRKFLYVGPGYYHASSFEGLKKLFASKVGEVKSAKHAVDVTPSSAPVSSTVIRVPSSTVVYLAPGCYINGTLAIEDAQDVSIIGRGICRPSDGYEGIHVHRSKDILIDGVTLCTCPVGGSSGITLHDVRSISHPGWGDGLNVFASSHVLYDRVFCRNSDDCTTAYATRKGFSGSVNNVRMQNSILWADVAHPIFIGIHGAGSLVEKGIEADSIVGLVYENIDILCHAEAQVDYQGCLAINCGDNNLVRDVLFKDIRIENIIQGCLFQIKVSWNDKYCTAPGRGVEDVTFRNITYKGQTPYISLINGYDASRKVKNVIFQGLNINGTLIYDSMPSKPGWYKTADFVPAYIGNHVENVSFLK